MSRTCIRLMSMLLLPLACVVIRSAKQFRLQCTLESLQDSNDVNAGGSMLQRQRRRLEYKQPQYQYWCMNNHSVSRTHKDYAILQR